MDSNDLSATQDEEVVEQPEQSAGQQDATEAPEQPVEEVSSEETQEVDSEPEEAVEENTQSQSPPPSRRENLRIQALVEKMRRQEPQIPRPTPAEQMPSALNYKDTINADDEVIKNLEEDRQQFGQTQFERGQSEGIKQAQSIQFHTRLEIDAPKVASKYPQFDKDSERFNAPVADALNNWYLATAGYDPQSKMVDNPNIRYYDFVDGIMELAEVIAGEQVQESSKNIAKQAAKTSVRPDGSKAKRLNLNKAPQDMTDEELDAIISTAVK